MLSQANTKAFYKKQGVAVNVATFSELLSYWL
jgi:hypothetical protein